MDPGDDPDRGWTARCRQTLTGCGTCRGGPLPRSRTRERDLSLRRGEAAGTGGTVPAGSRKHQPVIAFNASPSAPASSGVISTTRRPPPSSGTRMTMPRPSLVTSSGPSPVRGFIAAILSPLRPTSGSVGCPTASSSTPRAQPPRDAVPRIATAAEGHCAYSRGPTHRADQTFSLMNTGEPKLSPAGCDSV